jgi:hypothetical protein
MSLHPPTAPHPKDVTNPQQGPNPSSGGTRPETLVDLGGDETVPTVPRGHAQPPQQSSEALIQRLHALDAEDEGIPGKSRQRSRLGWIIGGGIVLVVAVAGGAGWLTLSALEDPHADLQFEEAKRGTLILSVVERGELEASKNAEIHVRVRAKSQGS